VTITLYRSRWLVYHGRYAAVDAYEWSFAPIEPSRTFGRIAGSKIIREPDGELLVVTPALARMVEVGERRVARLAFHGEDGIDAESVSGLASRGERGFRVERKAECERNGNGNGHDHDGGSLAGFLSRETSGSESTGPRSGAATPGRSKSLSASYPRCQSASTSGSNEVSERDAMAKKLEQPNLFGDLDPPDPPGAYGRRPPREDRVTPIAVYQESVGPGLPEIGTPIEAVHAFDERVVVGHRRPTSPRQVAIDNAGTDLVADIDAALEQIRAGSGITAIRILERVRETLVKGPATK
jgi:hypothetical protein